MPRAGCSTLFLPPYAATRISLAHLFGSKARPPPARRSHAHGAAHAVAHRRLRSVACGLPSLPQPPLPAPASRAAHPAKCAGLCGAHTHTVGCPALVADEAAPQLPYGTRTACSCAAAARGRSCATPPAHSLTTAWRTLRRTLPPETPAYTRRATGPIRAPRCEFALHLPFGRQCTGPASSHGEAAPPTAQRPHCTAACSSHTRLAHDPHR